MCPSTNTSVCRNALLDFSPTKRPAVLFNGFDDRTRASRSSNNRHQRLPPSGVERVKHTMTQMFATVVNEHQDDWDTHLPHVEFVYSNSVSAATGLAPSEIHMGRLPHFPHTVFFNTLRPWEPEPRPRHLEYCDLTADRLRRSYELVREQHSLMVSRVQHRNSTLTDALHYAVGGGVWVFNSAPTIHPCTKAGTDAKGLKAKLPTKLYRPFRDSCRRPCLQTRDQRPAFRHASCRRQAPCIGRSVQTVRKPARTRRHAEVLASRPHSVRSEEI